MLSQETKNNELESREGELNKESSSEQKDLKKDELSQLTTGGELHEKKEELADIIARNKMQVGNLEQNPDSVDKSADEVEPNLEKPTDVVENQSSIATEEKVEEKREILEQFDKEKTPVASTSTAKDDDEKKKIKDHAEEVYQINDPEQQIERIVQLATTKDPFYAVKVAQHLDDNYILNEVHDRLVEDKVREELIKRGILNEI